MKDTLSSLPGVANVTVDFDNRLAHCKIDPEKFSTDQALESLAGVRKPGTLVKSAN